MTIFFCQESFLSIEMIYFSRSLECMFFEMPQLLRCSQIFQSLELKLSNISKETIFLV